MPGSSGSFDVQLIDTDPVGTAGFSVSLDSIELAVSGPSGVAFTDVTINTIVPYIYTVSATTLPGSDPLNFGITFPNTGFTVADADGASPFFQTVNPGDTFWPGERLVYGQPDLLRDGHDRDHQSECWHSRCRTSTATDPVHRDERLDLHDRDPRALDTDPGRDRRLDRARRGQAAAAVEADGDDSIGRIRQTAAQRLCGRKGRSPQLTAVIVGYMVLWLSQRKWRTCAVGRRAARPPAQMKHGQTTQARDAREVRSMTGSSHRLAICSQSRSRGLPAALSRTDRRTEAGAQ